MVSPLRTDQKEPKLLVRQDSSVLVPAVTGLSQLVWNRCYVPLTSDPKITWRVLWGLWDLPPKSSRPRRPGAGANGKGLRPWSGGFSASLLAGSGPA